VPVTPPAEPIPAPKGDSKPTGLKIGGLYGTPELTPTAAPKVEGPKVPFDLDRRYAARASRAADCSWLTGQLLFVHADGGTWVVRYAPVGEEDENGGSVVLTRNLVMDSFREGDLVTVRGEVLAERGSVHLGGPLYRASSITLEQRLND
jgi:hypothetical protein